MHGYFYITKLYVINIFLFIVYYEICLKVSVKHVTKFSI